MKRANSEYGRTANDVDIMIRRSDLEKVIEVAERHGFRFRHVAGGDMLCYGDRNRAKDATHLWFSGEKVRPDQLLDNPELAPQKVFFRDNPVWIIPIEHLVSMKLNMTT